MQALKSAGYWGAHTLPLSNNLPAGLAEPGGVQGCCTATQGTPEKEISCLECFAALEGLSREVLIALAQRPLRAALPVIDRRLRHPVPLLHLPLCHLHLHLTAPLQSHSIEAFWCDHGQTRNGLCFYDTCRGLLQSCNVKQTAAITASNEITRFFNCQWAAYTCMPPVCPHLSHSGVLFVCILT